MPATSVALIARWVARVGSIFSLLTVFAFAVGEGITGPQIPPEEWVGLAFFPVGVCVGLLLAWFREASGGALALACLIAFYAWNLLRSGHLPRGPFFFLLAAPALIFLMSAYLARKTPSVETQPSRQTTMPF